MVCVSLFSLPLAQLRAMLAGSVMGPGWYMKHDLRTVIRWENDQAKNQPFWTDIAVFLKVKYSCQKPWMIYVIIFREQKYLTQGNGNASNQWEKHLFLIYWFRHIDRKAMEKPATAPYGRWRIADVLTTGLIRTRLCFYSTLTTVGREEDRGVEELSYFPRDRRERFPCGWIIMWLYLTREKFARARQREGGEELVIEHLS